MNEAKSGECRPAYRHSPSKTGVTALMAHAGYDWRNRQNAGLIAEQILAGPEGDEDEDAAGSQAEAMPRPDRGEGKVRIHRRFATR
jgi:hypothetical protein